jgi:hypothetical protein
MSQGEHVNRGEQELRRVSEAAYRQLIAKRRNEATFWILIAFLPTFLIARAIVYLAPQIFLNAQGTHIHHFTYGIILLAVAGYLALTLDRRWQRPIAVLYGIGLALAFDEFGMWLRLQDSYWVRQSYDAIGVITALLILLVYVRPNWGQMFHRTVHTNQETEANGDDLYE